MFSLEPHILQNKQNVKISIAEHAIMILNYKYGNNATQNSLSVSPIPWYIQVLNQTQESENLQSANMKVKK